MNELLKAFKSCHKLCISLTELRLDNDLKAFMT